MTKKDSVAKGGLSVAIARMLGMVLSFLLFLILARHSAADAGIFRTVITYIVIAEFLGMLGMHRWLATEIAPAHVNKWALFLATNVVMLFVSIILIAIYLGISYFNIYSEELNEGLRLAALGVLPTGIYQCVQASLVGIGRSHTVGVYNGFEYLARCSISILLIYLGYPIVDVIWVFILTRWVVTLYSFYQLSKEFQADHWWPSRERIAYVLKDAPRFLMIIFAFLLLRNSALVLLPALVNEAEAAVFAVAYQLFDMILLIPSVLAITSNHVFVNKANQSNVALRRVSTQLVSITSMALFPCIAITAAFSHNFLLFLYGEQYLVAQHALVFLMIASGLAMVDQVLSQIMVARKDYKSDMVSILVGGVTTVILTVVLVILYGASGAAVALMAASFVTVCIRLKLLTKIFSYKLLLLSIWRATLAAFVIYIMIFFALKLPIALSLNQSKYLWIAYVPVALAMYVFLLYVQGAMSLAKRGRIKQFLFH